MIEQMLNSMSEKYKKVQEQRVFLIAAVSFLLESELNEEELHKFKLKICYTFMDLLCPDTLIQDDYEHRMLSLMKDVLDSESLVQKIKEDLQ